MPTTEAMLNGFYSFLPFIIILCLVSGALALAHFLIIKKYQDQGNEKLFSRQLIMLGLTLVGVLLVVLSLPVSESSRNQIIGLIGLVISGIFAFSSSTIFANLLAGIMLRITKPFNTGEFIQIGDYFGRVVERGLLDTEIQTEIRDLVSLPNTYMITHPVSVTHSSGTIISTTLSLGYDVHHSIITNLLNQAAEKCGLTDSFVHIIELGDFAVTYKISGKLEEVNSMISSRSLLNREVLDVLHNSQIEIMSPSYMNQRKISDDAKVIPKVQNNKVDDSAASAEEVMFDKAEQAELRESQIEQITEKINQTEVQLGDATTSQKDILQNTLEQLKISLKELNQSEAKNSN
ncbi:mechanosensitive ion channel domain-containing protein [Aliiglaciecola sp. LCG003]|uniref:mechanosensitive ion channel domain-containing protein n=1 Tax=Aliiglaciecola sp. LCG003 TaxID=3053655 RepID=UPI002573E204|nr:mechanosensitive ion channel domain-containing protein [Aliiglaciecola sp. LCG003]WJG09652.1 mechanosensitive ion channel [Aliiglaciecola sp. LCG003]